MLSPVGIDSGSPLSTYMAILLNSRIDAYRFFSTVYLHSTQFIKNKNRYNTNFHNSLMHRSPV